jgi:hypothetical protein
MLIDIVQDGIERPLNTLRAVVLFGHIQGDFVLADKAQRRFQGDRCRPGPQVAGFSGKGHVESKDGPAALVREGLEVDVMNHREVRRVKELKLLVLGSVAVQNGQMDVMLIVKRLNDVVDGLRGQGREGRM